MKRFIRREEELEVVMNYGSRCVWNEKGQIVFPDEMGGAKMKSGVNPASQLTLTVQQQGVKSSDTLRQGTTCTSERTIQIRADLTPKVHLRPGNHKRICSEELGGLRSQQEHRPPLGFSRPLPKES